METARVPVWSVSADAVLGPPAVAAPPSAQPRTQPAAILVQARWQSVATSFAIALGAFYTLQFAVSFLAWYDAELRTPGQTDAMVAWAVCAALTLPALLLRGRWRALPLCAATVAGSAAPLLLSRDLLSMLGIPDVWVGQALTLHVLYPLCLGIPATIAALVPKQPGVQQ